MTQKNSRNNRPQSKTAITALFVVVLIFLIIAVGFAGYLVGRFTATVEAVPPSTPQVLTEVQEVTREVTREVSVVVTSTPEVIPPTIELIRPMDGPDVMQTTVPIVSATPENDAASNEEITNFDTYDEVWSFIEENFDGDLPEEQRRMYAAIAGSLETLNDDYTRFIRPDVAQRMREDMNGSVSGIGAFVRENDDGFIEITRPIDGQPADLAGILAGDLIIAVDGVDVANMDFDEVLLMVRGPEGSTVDLTIWREGEADPLEFAIVRTLFEVPVVEADLLGSEEFPIAYVQLSSFTRSAESAVDDALSDLLPQDPQAIILDLRDNGGGFLDQAVAVADIFLDEGAILFERSNNGMDNSFDSDSGDLGENLPLVVLVNAGSASASEIVAGAVQDRGRGILIGETTFGKGSVQLVHNLSDGSELRVTIARWYTPNNISISDEGIQPDIEISTPLDLGGEDDTQLQGAIDYLLESQ